MAVSVSAQCAALGVACLLPLIFTDTLPRVALGFVLLGPPAAAPPPPPADRPAPVRARTAPRQFREGALIEPARMPARAALIVDQPDLAAAHAAGAPGVPGGVPGGIPGGIPGSILRPAAAYAVPPPPAAHAAPPRDEAPAPPPARIRQGGRVQAARAIHQPTPLYPKLAIAARIQGVVRLEGIIGADGRIRALRAISGHPLLIPAALETVRTWVYRPAILNGDPVEVIAPIEVTFTLGN